MPFTDTRTLKQTVEEITAGRPDCQFYVTAANRGVLMPIYGDPDFIATIANPMTSDTAGLFDLFYLPDDDYRILVQSNTGETLYFADNVYVKSAEGADAAHVFTSAEALLEDTTLSYDDEEGSARISAGEIIHIYEIGASYRVAEEAAFDHHLITESGIKLYVLPGPEGYNIKAFAPQNALAYQTAVIVVPEGATLHHPADWSLDLEDGIIINKALRMTGGGLLNFTDGITQKAGLQCIVDGCEFIGLRLANPNQLQSDSGDRNYGIEVLANEVLVQNCELDRFQNGIAVRSSGEFHNIRILGNRVKDCIGAGGGADDTPAGVGEDRGDGIVVWGAQATIQGNVVNAMAGQDCRVGIHAEGLPGAAAVAAPHSDALIQVSGNVIYGPFRRGIVNENTRGFTASSNVVADATWWALASVEGAENSSFTGNSVIWTRTAADNHGASWAPVRAPLCFYGTGRSCVMADNTVWAAAGSEMDAVIVVNGPSATRMHLHSAARGNHFVTEDGTATVTGAGLLCTGFAEGFTFADNILQGAMLRGAYVPDADSVDITLRGNLLEADSPTFSTDGIRHNGPRLRVEGNELRNFEEGIEAANATSGWVRNNCVVAATNGINLFGSSGVVVTGNDFVNVTGQRIRNVGTAQAPFVTGNTGQMLTGGGSWSPGSIATGAAASQSFTVSGASLGDAVDAVSDTGIPAGLVASASVAAADTVTVTLFNGSGGAVDPGAGNWELTLRQVGSYS